jgi:hypothetical protein
MKNHLLFLELDVASLRRKPKIETLAMHIPDAETCIFLHIGRLRYTELVYLGKMGKVTIWWFLTMSEDRVLFLRTQALTLRGGDSGPLPFRSKDAGVWGNWAG